MKVLRVFIYLFIFFHLLLIRGRRSPPPQDLLDQVQDLQDQVQDLQDHLQDHLQDLQDHLQELQDHLQDPKKDLIRSL